MNLGFSQTVLMILFSQQISIIGVQNTHHRPSVIKKAKGYTASTTNGQTNGQKNTVSRQADTTS